MEKRAFKFTIDEHEIEIPLEVNGEDSVLFEQINPWSDKRVAAVIPFKHFISDMNALIPDHLDKDLDKVMYPRLLERITVHIKVYRVLADSDYCTYMNYFYLLRHYLAEAIGVESISEADQKGAMLGFYQWLKQEGIPVEITNFREL